MHFFVFFRDFRLRDNLGLIQTLKRHGQVVPIFVFTPQQIDPEKNAYFSHNSVQFLCESLQDLQGEIKAYGGELYVFYGGLIEVLDQLHQSVFVSSLSFNIDYTPYARDRTASLQDWGTIKKIPIYTYEDYLLCRMGTFLHTKGKVYTIYSFFRKKVEEMSHFIQSPSSFQVFHFARLPNPQGVTSSLGKLDVLYERNDKILLHGGRKRGQALLQMLPQDYDDKRNDMNFSTSHLSPYIKYGCVSVREVFYAFIQTRQQGLRDQLIWREFYTYITYYFPEVLQGAFWQKKYAKMEWVESTKLFDAWKNGLTGYPIVDACMRELNTTGYMHNRGRLIAGNFLNRLLHMDWRKGERYFATKLIDYDPAVNNGNWQWLASTGVDPKPYFQRLFNPFLQGKRFDPQARYIKKWLPQLAGLPIDHIHNWHVYHRLYDVDAIAYCRPIVDYVEARKRSILRYKNL